ncbi:Gamma-1-syntrophin [Halocaridina rubra]|uniref:Gamma-1-syntrophin n=1 Tax=Halocaridina rubra TaxID=373956 RepID=A0AAN8ZWV2_HALRR
MREEDRPESNNWKSKERPVFGQDGNGNATYHNTKKATLNLHSWQELNTHDWVERASVWAVHQTMFRIIKESEYVDERQHCFLLQTAMQESRYLSVETRQELLRIENAWHRAVYNAVTRLGSKTFAVTQAGRSSGLTLDWTGGFALYDTETREYHWRYKFSQLKGSSDDSKTKLKLHFQNETKEIETKGASEDALIVVCIPQEHPEEIISRPLIVLPASLVDLNRLQINARKLALHIANRCHFHPPAFTIHYSFLQAYIIGLLPPSVPVNQSQYGTPFVPLPISSFSQTLAFRHIRTQCWCLANPVVNSHLHQPMILCQ